MIRRGDRLENPVTGETLIFHETSWGCVLEGGSARPARVRSPRSSRWNAGDQPVRFLCRVSPALEFESLIETMFGLAADGKTNRKGMPNPLRLAVLARSHFDTVRLPFPPAWLQRAALAVGARLGLLLGYWPTVAAAAA